MIKAISATKRFGEVKAVNNLTCEIPKGSVYGLIGSNGAGKSTFLRMITGVYKPDDGEVRINGDIVYENPVAKKRFAYVPDGLYFAGSASMRRMAALYQNVYSTFDMNRFNELTAQFKLNPKVRTGTFSKGMRRQAAVILALSIRSEYVFFDETFDGLDPVMRNVVRGLIAEDVAERNTTVILTSHSLRELEDTCDQLALLHKGGLVFESDVQDLQTSLFKVQIAFNNDFSHDDFEELTLQEFRKQGSVANFIVRGDREETRTILQAKNPVLLDILPLSLEEVFIHEMQAVGYSFDTATEGGNDNV